MTHVAKVVEIIGSSSTSWEDAAQNAIYEAIKTVRGVRGIEIIKKTATVNPDDGKIAEYRSTVKIAFAVEHT
ncbi:MAG: dodecin family protein [Candidatus Nitrosocosmicus sp.]|jgi:flavin-binding protein dodecin|uniref:dodecin family protein n=1 Tax=Candidatus Nitrosocosmicus agrestis TaxID=2563600 RepID=UPI00122E62F1|nr:dodecin family protein [Candidatus Nitrosocosmicus sp. SS]KAA2281588.1 dodecin domain-containing protein [Candidatus Nitrosocosmicus sp. SS]KAF0869791.1 dodecin domain-containing protein [Candidatus Nitrosocosmicus sp. SS]MDR4490390.1 dodecin family protein [Candidatus Nitrosocosmicus sp.]HET8792385.1 dodecin family protein [Nitrososphaeraceae archaeon]